MTRPRLLQSRSDGRFFRSQLRALRGLKNRVDLLQRSWSSDTEILDQKRRQLIDRYSEQEHATRNRQAEQSHHSIETWDLELDRALEGAEREFLTSVESEKRTIEKLKEAFVADKQALKKQLEGQQD